MDQPHINEADLEKVWFTGNLAPADEQSRMQNIVRHCQECSTCHILLNSYLEVEREIESLKHGDSQKDPNQCPAEEQWLKFVAGVLDDDQAFELLKHASSCNRCTQRLSAAQKYLAEDLEAPERKSASEEWRAEMARKIVAESQAPPRVKPKPEERRRLSSWAFWLPITAVATTVAIIVAWFFIKTGPQQEVEQLLGQAYSENRTLEPRLAHASYGPVQIERGPNIQSQTSKPSVLLKAEESLSRHLREEPNNPVWLDLKGRADLLDGNYVAALKSLQDALQIQPDSIPILTDTATAYFELAEIADRPEDYGKAIELLSRALNKKPDDPVALYNRALANEKMFLYYQAMEDWQHYLQIDSKGEWADEANRRLNALRKKVDDHERSVVEPVLEARAFLEAASIGRPYIHAEQYLDQAIREWLPIAFPVNSEGLGMRRGYADGKLPSSSSNSSPASHAAILALKTLSEILLARHDDHWLSDLISVTQSRHFPVAIRALQQAIHANSIGDFATAKTKSIEAARLFRKAKNLAGEMRARCEIIYALERSFQEKDRCLVQAAPVANELRHHQYPWIQVQLYLEQSNCWSQIGDFGQARRYVEEALSTVERSKYPVLRLRALGMAAALDSRQGDDDKAYSLDRNGLAEYWGGAFPPMRAYQFYSDLGTLAEAAGTEWNFAVALAQEAVAVITLARQPLAEAFAHHRLAKIALMAGNTVIATSEFDRAKHMFSNLPQTRETWAYEADAEIELARLQAAHGDARSAWQHLSAAGAHISQISHYSIALSYYKTLADIQRSNGNMSESVKALYSAMSVAESGLGSLRSEDERLRWARETNQVYRQLAEFIWRSHDVEAALRIWELYRGAAVRDVGDASRWRAEVARNPQSSQAERFAYGFAASENQTILSYMQVSDGLVVWVLDDHGVISKWIEIPQEKFDRLANSFRDECADRNSNLKSLRQHAKDLYNLLVAPIADHLSQDRTLVLEPDDSMAEIPMAALIDSAGHYLNESYTIVVSPGLLYRYRLRNSKNLTARDYALVVGSPAQDITGAVLDPLEEATEEATYVAAKFRSATLLIGAQATLERVQRKLTGVTIFHFAGHGLMVQGKGGLLLAPSRVTSSPGVILLDAANLISVKIDKLQLVVLSACSTAGKREDNLGAPGNLVRLFLAAGVPHVVASRWNVDSNATIVLMQVFYDELLTGKSVPVSLRIAAHELRSRPITAHPYYWAAFAAFGS